MVPKSMAGVLIKELGAGCGAHSCDPGTGRQEAGGAQVKGQLGLHNKTLFQKQNQTKWGEKSHRRESYENEDGSGYDVTQPSNARNEASPGTGERRFVLGAYEGAICSRLDFELVVSD
jgi:hypothetical protein